MEIKVREMTEVDSKSAQQVEQELLDKHESELEQNQTTEVKEPEVVETNTTEDPKVDLTVDKKEEEEKIVEQAEKEPQLDDNQVLSYIEQRYGKQINSFDELLTEREQSEELPEDVAAYFKYKKETGRNISDFVKLQRDYSDMNPDSLLREYYAITEEGLDSEDIDMMMDDFKFDEEVDEPAHIKKLKLTKKKEIAKAKKFFRQQQELYKQPLESRESSGTASEELQAYRQYLNDAKNQQEEASKRSQWFVQKSNELFSPEFKGFKFKIDDSELVYSPGSASELRKAQETPMNFVNKYLDDQGLLVDPEGYHRSLAIAMNPEKFARFFYEQGQSQATDNVMRKTKNIDMTERSAPQAVAKGGMQVKALSQPSSRGLRIKSIKKS